MMGVARTKDKGLRNTKLALVLVTDFAVATARSAPRVPSPGTNVENSRQ
jgi:hypothetical protein